MRHDRSKIIEAKGGGCSVRISRLLLLRRDKTRRKYKKEMVFAVKAGTKILTHLFHARTRFSRHVCHPSQKPRGGKAAPGTPSAQLEFLPDVIARRLTWFIFHKKTTQPGTKSKIGLFLKNQESNWRPSWKLSSSSPEICGTQRTSIMVQEEGREMSQCW